MACKARCNAIFVGDKDALDFLPVPDCLLNGLAAFNNVFALIIPSFFRFKDLSILIYSLEWLLISFIQLHRLVDCANLPQASLPCIKKGIVPAYPLTVIFTAYA